MHQLLIITISFIAALVSAFPASSVERDITPFLYLVARAPGSPYDDNIGPQAAALAKELDGKYIYNVNGVTSKITYGPLYVGVDPAVFNPDGDLGLSYRPLLVTFDSVHMSLNTSGGFTSYQNLIVRQALGGEAYNGWFPDEPIANAAVVTNFGVNSDNEVTLYGVRFPGWTACPVELPGGTGFQLFYQRFSQNGASCAGIELFETSVAPPSVN